MNRLRQAGQVRRFHTVSTIGHQTVAEHSFNLCLILLDLFDGNVSANLLKAAMYHDLPEVETGDIPATLKWRSKEISEALKNFERSFEKIYGLEVELTEDEQRALKWADMYELVLYCLDQLEMGNRNMLIIADRGVEYLCELPAINETSECLLVAAQYKVRRYYEGE